MLCDWPGAARQGVGGPSSVVTPVLQTLQRPVCIGAYEFGVLSLQ